MQKFLVIQTAFIGDVVLATSILEALHNQVPGSFVDILVRKGNEALFADHPFLNEVLVWDKKKDKYRNLFLIIKKIRKHRYDKVINLQRYAATGIITLLSGAKSTVGFNKNPMSFLFSSRVKHQMSASGKLHEIERNQLLIQDFAGKTIYKPKLYPSHSDYELTAPYRQTPYICIAPASVWFTKQYPADKFIDLINSLPGKYQVYLLGAPGDANLCEGIKQSTTNKHVHNLAGRLTFLQSAALQQHAVMNFVNDSAPLHFASATNAPVTAIYCSTVPAFGFGPLSDASYIVETSIDLSCRPCGLHGYNACPLGHFKCALTIEKSRLLAVLENT